MTNPNERSLLNLLRVIIHRETVYLRHFYAKVVDVNDVLRIGRIRVDCYDLGMDTGIGIWASPRQKDGLTVPKIGDWVEIYFMGGDRNKPVYIGKVVDFENMLPKKYDGRPTTQVLYEDPEAKTDIVFDSILNQLNIGKTNPQPAARKGDTVLSDAVSDPVFEAWRLAFNTWALAMGLPTGMPASRTGKISSGSLQVNIGDQ